jgi:heme-binding NEAT domain protein
MPYSFKNCYLKSMSVNYAPQGTPSFFKGGKYTTEAEISLEFGEVEPVTRNDVQAGDLTQPLGRNSANKPLPATTQGKSPVPKNTPAARTGAGPGGNDQAGNISADIIAS